MTEARSLIPDTPTPRFALLVVVLAGIGFALASHFSHAYELPEARLVVVWFSSGVLFSAMVLLPWRWWVAVFGCGFVVNIALLHYVHYTEVSRPAALIAAGLANNADPLIAAVIYRLAVGRRIALRRLGDMVWLVVATWAGATFTGLLTTLIAQGLITDQPFAVTFLNMTLCSYIGSPMIAWLILSWLSPEPNAKVVRPWLETAVLAASALVIIELCFVSMARSGAIAAIDLLLILPLLMWNAVRWPGRFAATLLSLVVVVIASHVPELVAYTQTGLDPTRLALGVQVLMVVATISALLVSAISGEHQDTACRLERANEQLTGTTHRLETLIDASPIPMMALDLDGRATMWNRAAEQTFGWSAEEVLGKPLPSVASQSDGEHALLRERLRDGEAVRGFEMTRYRKDGTPLLVSLSASPLREESGAIYGMIGVQIDITAERASEASLKQERDFNAAILETVGSLVIVLDTQGRIVVFNRACEACSGYRAQEVYGKCFWDTLLAPEEREAVVAGWQQLLMRPVGPDTRAPIYSENNWISRDGQPRKIAWTTTVLAVADEQLPRYVIATGTDVTDMHRTEGALRAVVEGTSRTSGEAFFDRLVQNLARTLEVRYALFAVIDPEQDRARTLAFWDQGIQANITYALADTASAVALRRGVVVCPQGAAARFPEDQALVSRRIEGYMATRVVNTAGQPIGVLVVMDERPLYDLKLAETLISIFANRASVEHQRLRAEAEATRLRQLLQNILDSMPSSLIGVDAAGRVTHWNHESELLTGTRPADAVGRALREVVPGLEPYLPSVDRAIGQRQTIRHPRVEWPTQETTLLFDLTVYPLVSNGIDGAVLRLDDVTSRVRTEEMLVQSEKMLSLGGLAAGMAHEINNPLAGMLQSAQVIENRLGLDLPANVHAAQACGVELGQVHAYAKQRSLFDLLGAMRQSGQRAAAIVDNMLQFSRKSTGKRTPTDLAQLIDRTVDIARSDYDLNNRYDFRSIQIQRQFAPGLPAVSVEPSSIQQVLLNLLRNAAQAMFETHQPAQLPCITIRLSADERFAQIQVQDNGPGVSEADRRRVFEPFFTTKADTGGTGLGLPVSYFIVNQSHGGTLTVQSLPGQGATFTVRLPLTLEAGA